MVTLALWCVCFPKIEITLALCLSVVDQFTSDMFHNLLNGSLFFGSVSPTGCNLSVAYDMFGTLPLFSSTVSCMDYALMHMILAPCSFTLATFATMKQVLFVLYFALSVSALSNAFNGKCRFLARRELSGWLGNQNVRCKQ